MLTRIEEFLLLAVHALGDEAAGARVREHLFATTGRRVSVGAVYVPLERLVRRGLLVARDAEPTPVRGGRRRRFYRVTAVGMRALSEARALQTRMWSQAGLAQPVDGANET